MGRGKNAETAHLPPGVRQRNGRFYLTVRKDGRRREVAAGRSTEEMEATRRCYGENGGGQYVMPKRFVARTITRTRGNAASKGVPFALSADQLRTLIDATGGRCPISGIRFEFSKAPGERFRPWAPSVDRIVPQRGYVPGNVRVVCAFVNLAMNEFGEDLLCAVARTITKLRKTSKIAEISPARRSDASA